MEFVENIRDVHIGRIIRAKLREKSMTITQFALRIHKERTNAHDILMRKSIDTDLLITISKALDYDFIHHVYYKEEAAFSLFHSVATEEDWSKIENLFAEFIHFMKSKR